MTGSPSEAQLSKLWDFARGDTPPLDFEKWFLAEQGLEEVLGEDLHWDLTSSSYADREDVWRLRQSLIAVLEPFKTCECASLTDLAAVDMGGETDSEGRLFSELVFASLDQVIEFGPGKYWLYMSKCRSCATVWLIAQEERIYDVFFFQRAGEAELANALAGRWPERFWTYEDVLGVGREISKPFGFLDPMAGSLQWTVEDLLAERSTITIGEIANLLGITNEHAESLLRKVKASA